MQENSPLVYIIMPCYNGEKYLLEQLMSIYYQNYTNWYLIFVNDGSTDNSENVLRDWISHYNLHNKVKVINKENGGTNSAVQRGLEQVKDMCDIYNSDSFVAYCDADDVRSREKLNIQVDYMINNPEYGLSYHDLVLINENNIFVRKSHMINTIYLNDTFSHYATMGNHLTSTEVMFRVKYIGYIIPMPLGFGMNQDKWTALVLLVNNIRFLHIVKPLGYYRSGHISQMKLAQKASKQEMNKVYVRYVNEVQKRFPDKDLSYFIQYNTDRWIKWPNKGYSSLYIYIICLFKYPKIFFDGVRGMLTDAISVIKLKLIN